MRQILNRILYSFYCFKQWIDGSFHMLFRGIEVRSMKKMYCECHDFAKKTVIKKRIQNRIGDIYCVTLEDGARIYLQYVAIDTKQLCSSVIRVFKRKYLPEENIDLEEVVCGEVWFYAHTILRIAAQEGW